MADEISAWYRRRTRNCSFLIRSLMPSLHHLHFSLPCNTSIYGERKERISHRARIGIYDYSHRTSYKIIFTIEILEWLDDGSSIFFFLFHSSIHSSIQKSIFISQLNSSVHQKKKKVSVAWSSYDFADFLGHSLCLVTHNSIIVIMPLSFFASFFFFFGHLCLFDVRVSSNHVAFDSWN